MLDLDTLGKKIKELRNERKITQSDFAEILGVTYQAVSNWERGIAPPDLETLINIANYFGVLVDDLLNDRDEKLFLGIDGGGTKTEFVITTEDGHILDKFVRSGSNPNDIGVQNAFAVLCDGIKDALIKFPRISYAFLGIAGVSVADNAIRLANMLKDRSLHNFNTTINQNDRILTLSTCYNNTDKMVLHAKLIKKEVKQST